MNADFETRKLPLPPSHAALEHVLRALDCLLAWHDDPKFEPTHTDVARLSNLCAALAYAEAVAAHVKTELEHRLNGGMTHRFK